MMKLQLIISGVGGQGVLLATRIFAEMALAAGQHIIGSEDHGMSQRGGSVITHLKIGDFASPLVKKGKADLFLSLERNEACKTLSYVRPARGEEKGGLCFINAPENSFDHEILACLQERAVETYLFGADGLAREMGSVPSANIALIAFACAHPRFPFLPAQVREAIITISPDNFRSLSLDIFAQGHQAGQQAMKGLKNIETS